MLAVAYRLGVRPSWLGKREIFRAPFGGFMRWLGGIPVDRSARTNMVAQVVERFAGRRAALPRDPAVGDAPARRRTGSRASTTSPAAPGCRSSARSSTTPARSGASGRAVMPSGDVRADMDVIRAFYEGVEGLYPRQSHADLPARGGDRHSPGGGRKQPNESLIREVRTGSSSSGGGCRHSPGGVRGPPNPPNTPEHDRPSNHMVAAIAAKGDFPAAARVIQRLHDAVRKRELQCARRRAGDPRRSRALVEGAAGGELELLSSARRAGVDDHARGLSARLRGHPRPRDRRAPARRDRARWPAARAASATCCSSRLLCGSVARALSTTVGYPNPEEAYLLGLFANWGQLCLAAYYPERYERATSGRAERDAALRARARRGVRARHPAISRPPCSARWNFPAELCRLLSAAAHPAGDRPVTSNGQKPVRHRRRRQRVRGTDAATPTPRPGRAEAIVRARRDDVRAAQSRTWSRRCAARRGGCARACARCSDRAAHVGTGGRCAGMRPRHRRGGRRACARARPRCRRRRRDVAAGPSTARRSRSSPRSPRAMLAQENINDTLAMVLEGVARTGGFDVAFLALLNGRKDHLVGRLGYGRRRGRVSERAQRVPLTPDAGVLAGGGAGAGAGWWRPAVERCWCRAARRRRRFRRRRSSCIRWSSAGSAVGVMVAARGPDGAPVSAAI